LFGLLSRRRFQGSGCQSLGGGDRYRLHLRQIDIQSRSVRAERPADNDFSPTAREFRDVVQFFGGQLP